jgi:uncharacterized protein YjbI with pentapeptide repeats
MPLHAEKATRQLRAFENTFIQEFSSELRFALDVEAGRAQKRVDFADKAVATSSKIIKTIPFGSKLTNAADLLGDLVVGIVDSTFAVAATRGQQMAASALDPAALLRRVLRTRTGMVTGQQRELDIRALELVVAAVARAAAERYEYFLTQMLDPTEVETFAKVGVTRCINFLIVQGQKAKEAGTNPFSRDFILQGFIEGDSGRGHTHMTNQHLKLQSGVAAKSLIGEKTYTAEGAYARSGYYTWQQTLSGLTPVFFRGRTTEHARHETHVKQESAKYGYAYLPNLLPNAHVYDLAAAESAKWQSFHAGQHYRVIGATEVAAYLNQRESGFTRLVDFVAGVENSTCQVVCSVDLTDFCLAGGDYSHVDFSHAKIKGDLSGACFDNSYCFATEFLEVHTGEKPVTARNAHFAFAYFKGAKLPQSLLIGACFAFSDCRDVDLFEAEIAGCYWHGALMDGLKNQPQLVKRQREVEARLEQQELQRQVLLGQYRHLVEKGDATSTELAALSQTFEEALQLLNESYDMLSRHVDATDEEFARLEREITARYQGLEESLVQRIQRVESHSQALAVQLQTENATLRAALENMQQQLFAELWHSKAIFLSKIPNADHLIRHLAKWPAELQIQCLSNLQERESDWHIYRDFFNTETLHAFLLAASDSGWVQGRSEILRINRQAGEVVARYLIEEERQALIGTKATQSMSSALACLPLSRHQYEGRVELLCQLMHFSKPLALTLIKRWLGNAAIEDGEVLYTLARARELPTLFATLREVSLGLAAFRLDSEVLGEALLKLQCDYELREQHLIAGDPIEFIRYINELTIVEARYVIEKFLLMRHRVENFPGADLARQQQWLEARHSITDPEVKKAFTRHMFLHMLQQSGKGSRFAESDGMMAYVYWRQFARFVSGLNEDDRQTAMEALVSSKAIADRFIPDVEAFIALSDAFGEVSLVSALVHKSEAENIDRDKELGVFSRLFKQYPLVVQQVLEAENISAETKYVLMAKLLGEYWAGELLLSETPSPNSQAGRNYSSLALLQHVHADSVPLATRVVQQALHAAGRSLHGDARRNLRYGAVVATVLTFAAFGFIAAVIKYTRALDRMMYVSWYGVWIAYSLNDIAFVTAMLSVATGVLGLLMRGVYGCARDRRHAHGYIRLPEDQQFIVQLTELLRYAHARRRLIVDSPRDISQLRALGIVPQVLAPLRLHMNRARGVALVPTILAVGSVGFAPLALALLGWVLRAAHMPIRWNWPTTLDDPWATANQEVHPLWWFSGWAAVPLLAFAVLTLVIGRICDICSTMQSDRLPQRLLLTDGVDNTGMELMPLAQRTPASATTRPPVRRRNSDTTANRLRTFGVFRPDTNHLAQLLAPANQLPLVPDIENGVAAAVQRQERRPSV